MTAIDFPGANITYAKDQPEYTPLPAMVSEDGVTMTTVWELTDEELTQVLLTKRICITRLIFGDPPQPMSVVPVTTHW